MESFLFAVDMAIASFCGRIVMYFCESGEKNEKGQYNYSQVAG